MDARWEHLAATVATAKSGQILGGHRSSLNDWRADTKAAIPVVKPPTTGHGMKDTMLPSLARPTRSRITSAIRVTTATAPWVAMFGPTTTTVAPVGSRVDAGSSDRVRRPMMSAGGPPTARVE